MSSLSRVLGLRVALAAALLASACQRDTNAEFDDVPMSSGASGGAGAMTSTAGTSAEPGASGAGDDGGAGAEPTAGNAGLSSGGAAGMTGDAGKPPTAGKGGQAMGGAGANGGAGGPPEAGKAGSGGKPNPDPEPVTLDVTEFEDTTIDSCHSNEDFSKQPTLQTDGDFCRFEALLRPVPGDIPAGADVTDATLSLYCVNDGGMVTVSLVAEAWKDSTVRYNNRPQAGDVIGTVSCAKVGDVVKVDMTSVVTAWLSGKAEPYGVYLVTNATDGTDFGSSEAQKAEQRPVLTVTYTPAVK